ncbi:unnamed protein product, partial [Timema podura]|nr:unnamed protein product [Timema podura]
MRRLMLDRPPDPLDRVSAFERLGDYRPGVEPHRMDSIERYQSITNSSDTTFNSTQPSLTHAIEQRQSKYYSPPTEPSFDSERESSFYKERELNFNEERDGRFDQDKDRLYSRRQEKPRYDEGKHHPSTPDQDSSFDLPFISSIVYCESSVLDHASTERYSHQTATAKHSSMKATTATDRISVGVWRYGDPQ